MKSKFLIVITMLICVTISGCAAKTSSPTKIDNNNNKIASIGNEDFNINYKGALINADVPFQDIADKFGITIGKTGNNVEIKASGSDFGWYIVHYPNKENEEIQLEYVVNKINETITLANVNLLKAKTNRGISVGDDLTKLFSAYGDKIKPTYNSETSEYYYFMLDNKTITIVVDKKAEKISEINLDYGTNNIMEGLGMPSLD